MKILIFSFTIPYLLSGEEEHHGGTAVALLNWMKAFHTLGHDVALLTWKGGKSIIKTKVDFEIIESFDPKAGIPKLRLLYKQIPAVIRDLRKYNPDVIIQAGASVNCLIMGISAKIANKKFVHRLASDADVDQRTNEFLDDISLFFYRKSRKLVDVFSVQNDYQLDILKKFYPTKNIFKVYNSFNGFTNIAINPKSERKYVAWVGHFRRVKNLMALADICAKNTSTEFKIAGIPYVNLDADSANAIEKLKKMCNVEFVGYISPSQIQKFLSTALCLLNTSYLEGFSNTFLEAWSVGTPIVTTNCVNPDNLIDHFQLGLIANGFEELEIKMNEIINFTDEEYSRISKRCRDYVSQNHDPIILAKTFLSKIFE